MVFYFEIWWSIMIFCQASLPEARLTHSPICCAKTKVSRPSAQQLFHLHCSFFHLWRIAIVVSDGALALQITPKTCGRDQTILDRDHGHLKPTHQIHQIMAVYSFFLGAIISKKQISCFCWQLYIDLVIKQKVKIWEYLRKKILSYMISNWNSHK